MENDNQLYRIFKEFAEISSEGTAVFDNTSKRLLYVSPMAQQLTGLHAGDGIDAITETLSRVAVGDRHFLKEKWNNLMQGKENEEIEFQIAGPNDRVNFVCCSAYTSKDGMLTLFRLRDNSGARQHQNYLLEFGAKKNTTLDSVVHFVSGSVGLTQHLSFKASHSFETRNEQDLAIYIGLINENSLQCLKVVDELLQEEHLKSPEIAVKKGRSDIIVRVNYIVERLRKAYPTRDIRFTFSHPSIIMALDDLKVLQIVNNLLSNSIKFTPEEGVVTLHINDLGTSVVISVADNGIGIPDHLQPFIFDRNSAARRNGLMGERSNGTGLYICHILARLMNGRIWFESNKPQGVTFYLSLPKL